MTEKVGKLLLQRPTVKSVKSGHLPQHVYRSCIMSHLFRLRLHSHINTTPAHTHICQIQTRVIVFADDRGKGVRPNVYPKRNWSLLISSILIQDSDTVTISHSQPVSICGSFWVCSTCCRFNHVGVFDQNSLT